MGMSNLRCSWSLYLIFGVPIFFFMAPVSEFILLLFLGLLSFILNMESVDETQPLRFLKTKYLLINTLAGNNNRYRSSKRSFDYTIVFVINQNRCCLRKSRCLRLESSLVSKTWHKSSLIYAWWTEGTWPVSFLYFKFKDNKSRNATSLYLWYIHYL